MQLGRVADPAAHQLLLARAQLGAVVLARRGRTREAAPPTASCAACASASASSSSTTSGSDSSRDSTRSIDVAQSPLPLDQRLVAEQELGRVHQGCLGFGIGRNGVEADAVGVGGAVRRRPTISPNFSSYAATFCASSCDSSFRWFGLIPTRV